jgi:hypothetical protein
LWSSNVGLRFKETESSKVFDNNKKLPFFVRWWSWPTHSKCMVAKIEPKQTKTGLYGSAYGYFYNDDKKNEYSKLSCAGNYQWAKVSDND